MGTRFADLDELERLTGEPARWEYRMPGTGERTPPADAVLACPVTFNSVNKFAHGHADNFALGLLCEMAGYGVPVVFLFLDTREVTLKLSGISTLLPEHTAAQSASGTAPYGFATNATSSGTTPPAVGATVLSYGTNTTSGVTGGYFAGLL
jgi:Flavoprotein